MEICVLYTLLLYLIVGVRENVGVASWLWQSFVRLKDKGVQCFVLNNILNILTLSMYIWKIN